MQTETRIKISRAAGFDLDKYEADPEKHQWNWDDISPRHGIRMAVMQGTAPDKRLDTTYDGVAVLVEGWCLMDGLWIGRYKSKDKYTKRWGAWDYCHGQNWDDIWQG